MKLFEIISRTFGFTLKTDKPKSNLEALDINHEDGSTEIVSPYGGIMSLTTDTYQLPVSEVELIKTYRTLALTSDVDRVLNEIRNEIFIFDVPDKKAIDISFNTNNDQKSLSKSTIQKIKAEYDTIYEILDFQRKGLELFDRWYIDGRLFLHKIVNKDKLKEGIQKVIRIDPLKIRRIVEYPQPNTEGVYDLSQIKTYYVFSDIGDVFSENRTYRYMIISKDAMAYCDSGIYDYATGAALSNLWKMVVPYNNMKMMEEALLIYRVVRSPERRAFYISTGNLSKTKAEQYIKELMNRFKNKLVYDSRTGTVVDRKNVMSMVEDYWLPRREDGKGTEIQPLPGATNLGTIDDVELFKKKFLDASNIPASRFKDEVASFTFGRTAEISRDEYRFKKFLDRLRNRFVMLFEDLLKTQLLLKNIITETDWDAIKKSIVWVYAEDNNFVQWKEAEVLNSKIETMVSIDPLVGKYFDRTWVLRNVMKMTDDKEIEDLLVLATKDFEALNPPEEVAAEPEPTEDPEATKEPQDSENETAEPVHLAEYMPSENNDL
jgi:hypothetical protein